MTAFHLKNPRFIQIEFPVKNESVSQNRAYLPQLLTMKTQGKPRTGPGPGSGTRRSHHLSRLASHALQNKALVEFMLENVRLFKP